MSRRPPRKYEETSDAQPSGAKNARIGRIEDRILTAFSQVETGAPADRVLRDLFREARDLGPKERQEVSDTVFGMLRQLRWLDECLQKAAKSDRKKIELLTPPLKNRLRLLAYWAERHESSDSLKRRDAYAYGRIPGLFDRLLQARDAKPHHPSDSDQDATSASTPRANSQRGENPKSSERSWAIETSLPDWLAAKLVYAYGPELAPSVAVALHQRAPVTLRVNRLRMSREEARTIILQEHGVETSFTTLSPDGLVLPKSVDLQSWPLFREGALELMDEGSQLVALATGAKPGDAVLDACAGAGGKTLALGALLMNQGRLVAMDPDRKKLDALRKRSQRAGLTCSTVQHTDLLTLSQEMRGAFDCVLVDVPCTGTGTLRRSPDLKWRLKEGDVSTFAATQLRLLSSASSAVRAGGRLVYATCSILREENEDVTAGFLDTHDHFRPMRLETALGSELANALGATHMSRIGPGPTDRDPDGFFVATFERVA